MTSQSVLLFSSSLILLTLTAVCYLFFMFKKQQEYRKKIQISGLAKLNAIRRLLTEIQQHRGLSNGVLHGDMNLKTRVSEVCKSINIIQQDICDTYPDLAENERWQAMRDHWQRLAIGGINLPVRNNLEQHNKLVLNLLYLIDDIAFSSKLHHLHDDKNESIQFLWQELLFTAESIAQIRALGTGIAAAQICTRAERIRLNYLCQTLEQSIHIQKNQDFLLKISYLLKVIDSEITVTTPSITADRFFNIATESIDMVLASFDKQLEEITLNKHTSCTST